MNAYSAKLAAPEAAASESEWCLHTLQGGLTQPQQRLLSCRTPGLALSATPRRQAAALLLETGQANSCVEMW